MSTAMVPQLTKKLAEHLGMDGGEDLINVLKQTAFKGQVSDAQMTVLLIVANQYGLNPWTKEIYAFPDRQNGIVPVVGVDGWSRIINANPQFDGMEFKQDDESCTCIIHRKDRSHPVSVTEYLAECRRGAAGPWQTHPKRMLRHKAMIQCARLAFGFVGIFDQDEAERIIEVDITPTKEVFKSEARSAWDKLDTETQEWMVSEAMPVTVMIGNGDIEGAYNHIAGMNMDVDLRIAFNTRLDSKQRFLLDSYSQILHAKDVSGLTVLYESFREYAKPILKQYCTKRKAELTQPEQQAVAA